VQDTADDSYRIYTHIHTTEPHDELHPTIDPHTTEFIH